MTRREFLIDLGKSSFATVINLARLTKRLVLPAALVEFLATSCAPYKEGLNTLESGNKVPLLMPDGRISNVEFRYNENGIETISTPPKILIKHGEPIGRPINPKKPPRDREKGEILEPRLYKVVANILQVPKATGIGVYPSPYEIPYFGSGRSTAPHIPISDNNVYGIKVAAYPHDFVIGVGTQPDTMTEIVRYGLYQIPIKRTGEGWLVGYVETLNQGQKEERVIFRPKGYTHDGRVWYASK